MMEQGRLPEAAGFWRRIAAFFIDSIVIGVIGLGLGLVFEEFFIGLGGWGRLVGFGVALCYFAPMNSVLAGGQTLGKVAMGIRVVDRNDRAISPLRSTLRYCVLGVPFFLNGAQLDASLVDTFWIYLLSPIIFGGLVSTLYLYVFNRRTRQSLHDLAAGTHVVRIAGEPRSLAPVWPLHLAIVAVVMLAALVMPVFAKKFGVQQPFAELANVYRTLSADPNIQHVLVSDSTHVSFGTEGSEKTRFVAAEIYLRRDRVSDDGFARVLAGTIARLYPEAKNRDAVTLDLIYGFDIGIASKWHSQHYAFAPSELGVSTN